VQDIINLLTSLINNQYGDDLEGAIPIVANLAVDHGQPKQGDGPW